jgi:hypothetical protein
VPSQRDHSNGEKFDRQTVAGQRFCPPPGAEMEPPDEPDHRARYPRKNQVQQQDALQFLAFELKLPCQDARDDDWERRNGRPKQVVVSRIPQSAPLRPESTQVERDRRNEQRNRKMNQHDVLGVLGEYRRLEIKWIQRFTPRCATALRPPGVPPQRPRLL